MSAKRASKGSCSMEHSQIFYLSAVPKWTIENGKLTGLKLLSIELGPKKPWGFKGFLELTDPKMIFGHLQKVCEPMGNKLVINGNTIDVVL